MFRQHHFITDYRHNQKKETQHLHPTFSSSTSQWSIASKNSVSESCHKRRTSNRTFSALRKWSKISFESFNSCVQFVLEPLNIVSRSLHLFLSLFLLFLGKNTEKLKITATWKEMWGWRKEDKHTFKCEMSFMSFNNGNFSWSRLIGHPVVLGCSVQ